jgi:hypothetical protein
LIAVGVMAAAVAVLIGMQVNPVYAQNAPPPGYCADEQHDPTRWHPAVDPVTGCMYGHEHGADPNPPGSPFAPLVFGGDEATPNENFYKHNGYKVFYIHRSNRNSPAPTADPCDDLRVRIHMDVTPRERIGQYHSFEMAIAHCASGQLDVSYIQGWMDFGTVVNLSTRIGGDNGVRPNKFAPNYAEWQQYGSNIWEVWYGRSGLGLDMGWLLGGVPTVAHDGADPQNPATWQWTGNTASKRKLENFNFYGWRETRRGEFWTDQFGNTVNPNSPACQDPNNKCLRQYISPLFGTGPSDQIILNLGYDTQYDDRGINFPMTFPVDGPHLPWYNPGAGDPPGDPTTPSVRVDVNPDSAAAGANVEVTLSLFNVTNLYGLQATCQVDPAVLTGTTRADGSVFNGSNSLFVDKGFAADGSWTVAASLRQPSAPFTGNGSAFKLNYTVNSAGSSAITCAVLGVDPAGSPLSLQVINGSFNGQPVQTPVPPPATPTPTMAPPVQTPEPGPLGTVYGVVRYEKLASSAGITLELRDANKTVLAALALTEANANGQYRFADVPAGSYTLKIMGAYHLGVVLPVTVGAAGELVEANAMLLAGDTNNDTVIDLTDAGLIGANFSLQVPPAPASANLNGDGVVDIRDLVLIGANFDKRGAGAAD